MSATKEYTFGGVAPEVLDKLNLMLGSGVATGVHATTFQTRSQMQESINGREVSDAEPVDLSDADIPLTQERKAASDASMRRRKRKQPAINTSVFEDITESSKAHR